MELNIQQVNCWDMGQSQCRIEPSHAGRWVLSCTTAHYELWSSGGFFYQLSKPLKTPSHSIINEEHFILPVASFSRDNAAIY
jgi:hypothetical protein